MYWLELLYTYIFTYAHVFLRSCGQPKTASPFPENETGKKKPQLTALQKYIIEINC